MRSLKSALLCCCVLVLAELAPIGPVRAGEKEAQEVAQASNDFYAALNALFRGELAPMEHAWSHADDVTYMGPTGGLETGWKDVRKIWEEQAAKKLGGEVKPEKIHIQAGSDLAVTTCYEAGENVVNGQSQKVMIRATSSYRKENGHWKMIGHHTDLLPFLSK